MKPAAKDSRARDLASIHIGATALGMDTQDRDENSAYRSMLWTVGRVRSAAQLDYAGRKKVLEHLAACGYNARKHGKKPKATDTNAAQIGKIEALLAARGLPWTYITNGEPSMVKRICGVERIEWANAAQLGKLIAALSYQQNRTSKGNKNAG